MIQFIKKLFGFGPKVDYQQLISEGAQIIDVRTPMEYRQGHIKNALNIPLNTLSSELDKIDKSKPVITCCASGIRSGQAKGILTSKGYQNVYNGGGWTSLERRLS